MHTCELFSGASLTLNNDNGRYVNAIFMSENYSPIYFDQLQYNEPDQGPEPENDV